MGRRRTSPPGFWSKLWSVLKPVLAVSAAAGAGVAAFQYTRQGHYLVVNKVEVLGNRLAPTAEVLEYAGIELGTSLYRVDVDAVQKRVMMHPEVAEATVNRVPPDRIQVQVSEHVTRATVALGDGVYLVNREGKTFRRARGGEALDVPVLTGIPRAYFSSRPERAEELMRLAFTAMDAHTAAGRPAGELTEVAVDEAVGITLRLGEPGVEVVLGREDYPAKLQRLALLERELRARKAQAATVFLDNARHPGRVAVRLKEPLLAAATSSKVLTH